MTTSHPMPDTDPPTAGIPVRQGRRGLFRGGAALAAVTAGALVGGRPSPAEAADGDSLTLGKTNDASSTTTVQIGGDSGTDAPVLSLHNANGPSLELPPLDESWDDPLELGQIANKTTGPIIGIDQGNGAINAYIALSTDIQALPIPYAMAPERLVDTRAASQRHNIVATSGNAFSTSLRLRAGHWFDVAVLPADDVISIEGVWANVTVTGPLAGGYLTVSSPGTRPGISTINFGKGQTIANGGFFRPGVSENTFAVRIWSTAETHVVLDVTGLALVQQPGPLLGEAARRRARATRPGSVDHAQLARKLGR